MTVSTYAKNLMLGAYPNTVYAAFFNGGEPGVGTEIVPATLWGSGNRPALTVEAPVDGVRTPSGDASLGTVAVASQEVSHIALYDAATGGNMLQHDPFAQTLTAGQPVSWPDANTIVAFSDPTTETPETTGTVHVFLLAGQSNIEGQAALVGDDFDSTRVEDWDGSAWQAATSPLTGDNGVGNGSIAVKFAEDFLATVGADDKIAFVQTGLGGTSISVWTGPGDSRYDYAVARVNAALAAGGENYQIAGILWHQGEADSGSPPADYQTSLETMIGNFRSDITGASATTPFVLGEIYEGDANDATINGYINNIATTVAYTGVAQSDGLGTYDGVHFGSSDLNTFGEWYHDAFLVAESNASDEQAIAAILQSRIDAGAKATWMNDQDITGMRSARDGSGAVPSVGDEIGWVADSAQLGGKTAAQYMTDNSITDITTLPGTPFIMPADDRRPILRQSGAYYYLETDGSNDYMEQATPGYSLQDILTLVAYEEWAPGSAPATTKFGGVVAFARASGDDWNSADAFVLHGDADSNIFRVEANSADTGISGSGATPLGLYECRIKDGVATLKVDGGSETSVPVTLNATHTGNLRLSARHQGGSIQIFGQNRYRNMIVVEGVTDTEYATLQSLLQSVSGTPALA